MWRLSRAPAWRKNAELASARRSCASLKKLPCKSLPSVAIVFIAHCLTAYCSLFTVHCSLHIA